MTDQSANSHQYSAADIQRYLKGEMPAEEMHNIEKAALEDPFLADAIEGINLVLAKNQQQDINLHLHDLKLRLAEKITSGSRIIPMKYPWWKIAAAAIVIIISGAFVYLSLLKTNNINQLAVTEKQVHDTVSKLNSDSNPSSTLSIVIQPDSDKLAKTNVSDLSRSDKVQQSLKTRKNESTVQTVPRENHNNESLKDKDEKIEKAGSAARAEERIKPEESAVTKNSEAKISSPVSVAADESRKKVESNQSVSNAELLKNFRGRVVDINNHPIPNARVLVVPTLTGLTTDRDGQFNLTSKDSVLQVQVGLAGFGQDTFSLRNENDITVNQLVLKADDNRLNEAVLTGRVNGISTKANKPTNQPAISNAVPVIGWPAFEDYLAKNKKIISADDAAKGEVRLSFLVNKSGALSDFIIDQSLSDDEDAEALRLIKEGPSWKLLRGNKSRVTVIVKF